MHVLVPIGHGVAWHDMRGARAALLYLPAKAVLPEGRHLLKRKQQPACAQRSSVKSRRVGIDD